MTSFPSFNFTPMMIFGNSALAVLVPDKQFEGLIFNNYDLSHSEQFDTDLFSILVSTFGSATVGGQNDGKESSKAKEPKVLYSIVCRDVPDARDVRLGRVRDVRDVPNAPLGRFRDVPNPSLSRN
jgi:hypothetical protein